MKSRIAFPSFRTTADCLLSVAPILLALAYSNALFAQEPAPAPAPAAAAPQHVELRVDDKTADRLNRLGSGTIARILRGSSSEEFNAQNRQLLTDYYTKLIFTRMTQVDNLGRLVEFRDQLLYDDFEKCRTDRTKAVRDYLNELTTAVMFGIVYGPRRAVAHNGREAIVVPRPLNGDMSQGAVRYYTLDGKEVPPNALREPPSPTPLDFHPAVKYNAMLILGQLNNEVGLRGEDAVPRVEVLRPLLANIARNPNAPDFLRVGALLGIARHVELTREVLPPAIQALIADTMLGIVNEPLVVGREDGQIWLKQQAVDILGMLGFLGNEGAVVQEMAKVISDSDQPLPLRYATAKAFGQMTIASPTKMDTDDLLAKLGQLAADACREELYLAETRNQKPSRSRVLDRFNSVLTGLDGAGGTDGGAGVASVLDASQANLAQKLRDQINTVWESVVAATSEKEVAAKLAAGASGIENLLQANPPAAAAAADATDEPLPPLDGQPKADQPKPADPAAKPRQDLPF